MQSWQLKRNDTNAVLHLHGQYKWSDEYEWNPIAQSAPVRTLSGANDIQQGTKKAGRPITLDCANARIKRGHVKQLQAWASVAELELTLTHPNGTEYPVIFSRPSISDINEIKEIRPEDEDDEDPMTANISLITI